MTELCFPIFEGYSDQPKNFQLVTPSNGLKESGAESSHVNKRYLVAKKN
jgi:hypothetical protein